MGDEMFDADGMRFAAYDPDSKKWVDVGEPVSLSADDDGDDVRRCQTYSGSVSFRLTMPWYKVNEWYKIFTGRLRFTVRTLNRHKSWRGKWHRGGKGKA